MSILKVTVAALLLATTVTGCATAPKAVSHDYTTPDKSHWAVQISMYTGMPGTPQQTVMIVYNGPSKKAGKPIAIIEGQTKTVSEELMAQVIGVLGGATTAAISGNYALKVAETNCPKGTLCGTLVQVNNQAGATAGAEAEASSD